MKVMKIIMPRTYEKKAKPYNDATIAKALKEISDGASISATSKKYKIGYGKLHADYQRYKQSDDASFTMTPDKRVSVH